MVAVMALGVNAMVNGNSIASWLQDRLSPSPPCKVLVRGGFENLWRVNGDLRGRLGCPVESESIGKAAEQQFQRGRMYWFTPDDQMYVLNGTSGKWTKYAKAQFQGSIIDMGTPPAGLFPPGEPFESMWRSQPQLKAQLGWATRPMFEMWDNAALGAYQPFSGGLMLFSWGLDGQGCRIYVLFVDQSFDSFADTVCGR